MNIYLWLYQILFRISNVPSIVDTNLYNIVHTCTSVHNDRYRNNSETNWLIIFTEHYIYFHTFPRRNTGPSKVHHLGLFCTRCFIYCMDFPRQFLLNSFFHVVSGLPFCLEGSILKLFCIYHPSIFQKRGD